MKKIKEYLNSKKKVKDVLIGYTIGLIIGRIIIRILFAM